MPTITGEMRCVVNPFDVMRAARQQDWTPERFAQCFNGMAVDTAKRLLDGASIIQNFNPDTGTFDVYRPGHLVG